MRLRLECLEDRAVPATFNVTTALDVVDPADGKRSLREAVSLANTAAGTDTIVLPAGAFKIEINGASENSNATGDFDVTESIVIRGVGAGLTIINGQQKDRLFDLLGPIEVRFVGMSMRNGGGGASGSPVNGAAIQALSADVTVVDCALRDNRALVGGAINAENGNVSVRGSVLSGNIAQGDGGGIRLGGGILSLNGTEIRRNVSGGSGGGIRTRAANVSDSTISGNFAIDSGGGIRAIGSVTLLRSNVNRNSVRNDGGGVDANAVTLTGSTVSANLAQEGGGVAATTATLTGSTVSGNSSIESGGGVEATNVTATHSSISGNSTLGSGGGIKSGITTLTGCTISGNIALSDGGGLSAAGATILTNCTLSGNTAYRNGGGAALLFNGTILNCTIVENSAAVIGGGVYFEIGEAAGLTLRNTIAALNLVGFGGSGSDLFGTGIVSAGHNLIGIGIPGFVDGVNGDIVGSGFNPIDPKLGPLADHGGATRTHALLAGSKALDAGDSSLLPPTDQRGFPRKKDGNSNGIAIVDIGAFER